MIRRHNTPQTVTIIGGGIGGLFTGAILAREGLRVTVLEKNATAGGGLQCFMRGGKIYETGMHVMGGFGPGGQLRRICGYLGILDRLSIHHIDPRCSDEIRYEATSERFCIASGREEFVRSFTDLFPAEASGIRSYVDSIYRLADSVPLFNLRPGDLTPESLPQAYTVPADEMIASHVSNPRLRELLAYLNTLYGGVAGHTPAYVHAMINALYINGASRFAGGSAQLADALTEVIRGAGGDVLTGKEVTAVDVDLPDRRVKAVRAADGSAYRSDVYICAIHPSELLRIMPDGAFLRGYVRRISRIPLSCSAFSVFISLKPGRFPYIGHTCHYMRDFGSIWQRSECRGAAWPDGFMYMTPPDNPQGEYASRMLVHCIMDYSEVSRWDSTLTGRRGDSYMRWKAGRVARVMERLETLYPGFSDMTDAVHAASPLTIRDYYHTPRGAIFGFRKDCADLMLSQMSVRTKVGNLLLTGQNVNLHGICGVPLTAIRTAEAILGDSHVINRINDPHP